MEPSKVNTGVARVLGSYKHFMFSRMGFVFLAQPCCSMAKFRSPGPGFWQEQLAFLWVRTVHRMRDAERNSNETADFRQDYFPGFAKFIWNVQLLPRTTCTHQMHLFANEEQYLGNGFYFFKKLGRGGGRIETYWNQWEVSTNRIRVRSTVSTTYWKPAWSYSLFYKLEWMNARNLALSSSSFLPLAFWGLVHIF